MKRERQKVLSIRITGAGEAMILALQVALTDKLGRPFTKTDVIEAALTLLAKREKIAK